MQATRVYLMRLGVGLSVSVFVVLTCCIASIARSDDTSSPIVVEDPQPLQKLSRSTLPIVGFRAASSSFVDRKFVEKPGDIFEEAIFVPEKVVVKAWLQDKKFADLFYAKNLSALSIDEIKNSGIDISKFEWTPIEHNYASVQPMLISAVGAANDVSKIDSSLIIAMTSEGLLDLSNKYATVLGEQGAYAIGFNKAYAKGIFETYEVAAKYQYYPLSDPKVDWTVPGKLMEVASAQFPIVDFKKTLTFEVGNATFGELRVQSAREAGFQVDKRIAKANDVYLVEFAVTLYDLPTSDIDEVSFRVDCAKICTAWELAPMRVVAVDENTTSVNTPAVTFKDLTVGEFFKKTVTFKTLRPQIIAFGLREDKFSWSLKEDAVSTGSYVFLAALGVPKGTKNFEVRRSIAVRASDGLITEGG